MNQLFDSPISEWFELSYAQFLTIPRLVMEAMPLEWQEKMASLLHELDETFDWRPGEGRYWVRLRNDNGQFSSPPLWNYRHGHLEVDALRRDGFPVCNVCECAEAVTDDGLCDGCNNAREVLRQKEQSDIVLFP